MDLVLPNKIIWKVCLDYSLDFIKVFEVGSEELFFVNYI